MKNHKGYTLLFTLIIIVLVSVFVSISLESNQMAFTASMHALNALN